MVSLPCCPPPTQTLDLHRTARLRVVSLSSDASVGFAHITSGDERDATGRHVFTVRRVSHALRRASCLVRSTQRHASSRAASSS